MRYLPVRFYGRERGFFDTALAGVGKNVRKRFNRTPQENKKEHRGLVRIANSLMPSNLGFQYEFWDSARCNPFVVYSIDGTIEIKVSETFTSDYCEKELEEFYRRYLNACALYIELCLKRGRSE